MIEVSHLSKSFGSKTAVDDISFEVAEGEIVGFLGPNGAGKTTTMRLLSGFLSPDQGKIKVANIDVEKEPQEAQRFIGYMPENNPLYKEMLVSEMLALSADLKHLPKAKRRSELDFVVEATGIQNYYYYPTRELSKGYKQRVGLAIALLGKPKVIIMDEPTEGLDPNQRTEIRALIKDLAKKHTILMSTHVMQEAQAVCHRMLIINKGKITADGDTNALNKLAQNKRMIVVDIQGKDVEKLLSTVKGVSEMDVSKQKGDRVVAKLTVLKTSEVQPLIAELSHKHKWVIWKLQEEEQNLEEIFHQLTL